jgi:DNA polymerase III epsilon subunit-like protein
MPTLVWRSLTASPTESVVARIVPNDIQRVHGITDQRVQGKPTIERFCPASLNSSAHKILFC